MSYFMFVYHFFLDIALTICSGINQITIKKNRWLFHFDNIRDNSKYLMEYADIHSNWEIICYYSKKNTNRKKSTRIKYVCSPILLIYYYLTSKIIIVSFDFRLKIVPSKKQHIIQLWHGYALKQIGHDHLLSYSKQRGRCYSDILCYNEIWKEKLISAFGCQESQLRIWDNPRNDLLFQPMKKEAVQCMLGVKYNKLIIWLPTYRKSSKLHNAVDSDIDIPIINSSNIERINRNIHKSGNILVVKPHPLQNDLSDLIKNNSNVILIKNSDIENYGYEFYQFLAAADALITDYSSVYFDYLLLDKPVGFAFDDYEEYRKRRGFIFDNPKEFMCGAILNDEEKFSDFIRDPDRHDYVYKTQRKKVKNIISHWHDNCNCQRIFDDISKMSL